MPEWTTVVDGLAFPESLRWHDGSLFASDIFGGVVLGPDGVLVEVPARPSGLGWLPDGRLLVVAMRDRAVLVVDGGRAEVWADLSSLAAGDCNDMLVDDAGRAYVGNFGYDYAAGAARRPADLVLVRPDGAATVAARDVWFPNGMVLADQGSTLLVAETPAERITAFTRGADGTLHDRRVWADLGGARPDGISLDAEGGLWVASPGTGELLRVLEGGQVTDRLDPPQGQAQGCLVVGDELYACSTPTHDLDEALRRRAGRIDVLQLSTWRAARDAAGSGT